MPKKSAALIGPGVGPKVHLGGVEGSVQVRGLLDGEELVVRQYMADGTEQDFTVDSAGSFPMGACQFARMEYSGKSKNLIVCVIIGG